MAGYRKIVNKPRYSLNFGGVAFEGGGSQINLNTEGLAVLNTITFNFNDNTSQPIYTVPNGKKLIITGIVLREASVVIPAFASFFRINVPQSLISLDLSIVDNFPGLDTATYVFWLIANATGFVGGGAGTFQQFVVPAGTVVTIRTTAAVGFAATCKADLLGYLLDA